MLVFKLELAVEISLSDYTPDEGPLDAKDKIEIERQVIRLLSREYPEVDAEITAVNVEEDQ